MNSQSSHQPVVGSEILYLAKSVVSDLGLDIDEIISLTRDALLAHGTKQYEMPAKIGIHPYEEVFFHAMPAYVPQKQAAGMKWIECYPGNPSKFNLPQTTGLLILNDVATGCPLSVMDATWITAMRTPAVTALAAAALHPGAETFGMFGCGVQGIEHCRFIVRTLKKLRKIYVHDINAEAMDRLASAIGREIGVEILQCDKAEQVAQECEVLCSATIILKKPLGLIKDSWITAGQTLLPCDLNTYFAPETLRRADRYIVDSADEHRLFAGMGYFPEGMPNISAETGEVLAGVSEGRQNSRQIVVCSNIGMAVCDVVVAQEVFRRAVLQQRGTLLPL
jgi:ornithine cyclodeaminase/alanine dehydrogenase-like protein (mu-crystallin family)